MTEGRRVDADDQDAAKVVSVAQARQEQPGGALGTNSAARFGTEEKEANGVVRNGPRGVRVGAQEMNLGVGGVPASRRESPRPACVIPSVAHPSGSKQSEGGRGLTYARADK